MIELPKNIAIKDKQITLRFIQSDDAEIEQNFVRHLSPLSRRFRFFSGMKELPQYMLDRLTHPNYPKSCALIATTKELGKEVEIGVARYAPTDGDCVAEFSVVIADEWQHFGLAHILLQNLFNIAKDVGLKRIEGVVLRENTNMLGLAEKLGFTSKRDDADLTIIHITKLL